MAWLYVPGLQDSPCVPAEADSNWDSTSPSETPTELWASSSGKPTRRPASWRGWKSRPWIQLLYGTISRPSMASRGADEWISSLPVFLASHSVSRGHRGALRMTVGSGRILRALSKRSHLDWFFWRTSLPSSPRIAEVGLPRFLSRWPSSGSMRNGVVCEQAPLVLPTSETESSCWPTATAKDADSSGVAAGLAANGRHVTRMTLTDAARAHWPTPNASAINDGEDPASFEARRLRNLEKGINGNGQGTPLGMAVKQWPTPRASPNENRTTQAAPSHGNGHGRVLAGEACNWMTPRANDAPGSASVNGYLNRQTQQWATPSLPGGGRTPAPGQSPAGMLPDGTKRQVDLGWQARGWATPMAADGIKPSAGNRRSTDLSHQVQEMRKPGEPSSLSAPTSPRRLNPAFVEWLMGWPEGWSLPVIRGGPTGLEF